MLLRNRYASTVAKVHNVYHRVVKVHNVYHRVAKVHNVDHRVAKVHNVDHRVAKIHNVYHRVVKVDNVYHKTLIKFVLLTMALKRNFQQYFFLFLLKFMNQVRLISCYV
jgi:hypothetical protein